MGQIKKKLIKIAEAAELLGVSRQTIRNWGKSKVLTLVKRKRYFYVSVDAVEAIAKEATNVEEARLKLKHEEEALIKKIKEYNKERQQFIEECAEGDLRKFCYRQFVTHSFYGIIIDLLVLWGSLKPREGEIIRWFFQGERSIKDIAHVYGCTQTCITGIIKEGIRRASDISILKEKVDIIHSRDEEMEKKDFEINKLKAQIIDLEKLLPKEEEVEEKEDTPFDENSEEYAMYRLLNSPIDNWYLSTRVRTCLRNEGISTIGDLAQHNKEYFLKIRNFGKKSLCELDDLLEALNLCFGMDVSKYYYGKELK